MKKLIVLFGIILVAENGLFSQTNSAAATQLSHRIAKKMKDTLDLTAQQRQQVFQVNMQLHNQKQAVRQQNPPPDSLTVRIQRVERRRDSLYLPILGNQKYQLYLQKKRNLVSNN
jgi:hypothetical protein